MRSPLPLLFLVACAEAAPPSPDAGAPRDDGAVALPDASPPLDAGSGLDDAAAADASSMDAEHPDAAAMDAEAPCAHDDAGRCPLLSWTATAAFPVRVDHHTSFVVSSTSGDYLHVAGGIANRGETVEDVYSTVWRARIDASGALGPWEPTTPLPSPKAFHAQVVHGGVVYLLAGITGDAMGPGLSLQVLYGHMNTSGTVSDWQPTTRLPAVGRLHATAGVIGDRLYLVGGSEHAPGDAVSVATIQPDGSLGPWAAGPPLPEPRSHHASVVWDGRLYVLGGFTTDQAEAPAVLRSVVGASGAIEGWEEVGALPRPPWTHAAFVRSGFVYVVGGGEGSGFFAKYVDRIRRAPLGADGRLGEFEEVGSPLPRPRSHVHHAPIFGDRVYSVGGRELRNLSSLAEWTVGSF